jgi:hypothetical protein
MRPGVEALENLADGHLLFDEPAVEGAHQFGLLLVDHKVARHGILAPYVAIAIRRLAALVVPVAGLLQLASTKPLAKDSALVLRYGTLDLQQELVVGIVRDRMLHKRHLDPSAAEFFQQQHLIGVLASQAIGRQHGDELDGAVTHGIAQSVESGAVKPAAAVAVISEDMLFGEVVILGDSPCTQRGKLAVYGLTALLVLGRDAGIDGGSHGGLTLVVAVGTDTGPSRRRR